jgi:hypothetical protein
MNRATLHSWRALDPAERRLLVAGLGWVLAARAALAAPGRSFLTKRHTLDRLASGLPRLSMRSVPDIYWAVTAASKRVPGTVCLPWALALRGLLLQSGRACELRIGVAPGDATPIKAHAWVECEGRQLTWGDPVEGYAVLDRHGDPT